MVEGRLKKNEEKAWSLLVGQEQKQQTDICIAMKNANTAAALISSNGPER